MGIRCKRFTKKANPGGSLMLRLAWFSWWEKDVSEKGKGQTRVRCH